MFLSKIKYISINSSAFNEYNKKKYTYIFFLISVFYFFLYYSLWTPMFFCCCFFTLHLINNKSCFSIVFESIIKHTYLTTRSLMDIIMCPGGSIREQLKDWWPFRAWRSWLTFQCNWTSEAKTVQHYLIHSCSDTTKHCCTPAQVSLWAQEQVWQRERGMRRRYEVTQKDRSVAL